MDSAIRSDSSDAIITLEVNGRTFTIVLVEDPRETERDTARACELLGFQIFGLLDNVCQWAPRPRAAVETLPTEPVGAIVHIEASVYRAGDDVARSVEFCDEHSGLNGSDVRDDLGDPTAA